MSDRQKPLLQKAVAALQAGALDDAESAARATLDAAPDSAEAWDLLAVVLERKGQAADAVEIYHRALRTLPEAIGLHNNLALLLGRMGRPAEAEDQLRYAMGLSPTNPGLAANLGNLLADTGRFADAEFMLRTAISLAPDNPGYPVLLGRTFLAAGRTYDAKVAFAESVKLGRARMAKTDRAADPLFDEAYYDALVHLAGANFDEGKPALALALLQEAIHFGGGESIRLQFANCLCASTFSEPHPELKTTLVRALRESWLMSADLVRAITPLLLLEPPFARLLRKDGRKKIDLSDADARAAASDPVLLAILNEGLVTDPALENLLTAYRGALLEETSAAQREPYRAFAVALANQCFTNEYAFAESRSEHDAVAALETRLEQAVLKSAPIAEMDIATLAAYRPLNRLSWAGFLAARTWSEDFEPLIARQLREPAQERELAATIPHLTAIDDPTSKLVQLQYEENPYPQWIRTPVTGRRFSLDSWLRMHFPHSPPAPHHAGPIEVLVAGCGTGQEAIGSAQRFADSNVLAVDLSLGSLAYAMRKTAELGLQNISYTQADILALGKLDRRFDIIECAGVLHHMADPIAGWRVLSELCLPGGYMLMALYSEQGRKDLRPVAELAAHGYGTTPADLRRFRADVLGLDAADKARAIVSTRDDFYSLSMLRDLVFHVQEHRFTIGKIDHALRELGLEFCGFGLTPKIRSEFLARFGDGADLGSLLLWDTFESEKPETFAAMYHLVVRKPLQP